MSEEFNISFWLRGVFYLWKFSTLIWINVLRKLRLQSLSKYNTVHIHKFYRQRNFLEASPFSSIQANKVPTNILLKSAKVVYFPLSNFVVEVKQTFKRHTGFETSLYLLCVFPTKNMTHFKNVLCIHVVAEIDRVRESGRHAIEDGRQGGQAEQWEIHIGLLQLSDGQDPESM